MIKFFVCEDIPESRVGIVKLIKDTIMIEAYNMSVEMDTDNPDDILEYLKQNRCEVNAYFLDIHLGKEIDGIQLAERIRVYDPRGFIVIVTGYADMNNNAIRVYQHNLEAIDFISKHDLFGFHERVRQCVRRIYTRCYDAAHHYRDALVIKSNGKWFINRFNQIISIETVGKDKCHGLVIYTEGGVYPYRGTMKTEGAKLDSRFFKISQSCFINGQHIKSFCPKTGKVVMSDDHVVQVSSRLLKEFKDYLKKRLTLPLWLYEQNI